MGAREMSHRSVEAEHVLHVPLDQLLRDEHQPRKRFRRLDELALSIKNQGLQQLVTVNFGFRKGGKDYYYIKAGERRVRAHRKLGERTVPCIVVKEGYNGKRNVDRRLAQAAENSSREPQTHGEIIELVEEVIQHEIKKNNGMEYGAVQAGLGRIAGAFGMSRAWATNYHTLVGLLPELREMLDEDDEGERLNFSVGMALARAPADIQLEVLKQAQAKFKKGGHAAGYSFIVRKVREIREKRGEKLRGRASDEKMMLIRTVGRMARLADGLSGQRRSTQQKKHVQEIIEKMTVLEVDALLDQITKLAHGFSSLVEVLEKQRNRNYEYLSVEGAGD